MKMRFGVRAVFFLPPVSSEADILSILVSQSMAEPCLCFHSLDA